jgi:hypothetical protein
MRTLGAALCCVIAAGCGGRSDASTTPHPKLALQLPDKVVVHAGETLIVTLVAIGASGSVTFQVSGLPPYATADGNTIRANPTRADAAGDNTVAVTASDGTGSDSGSFVLTLANAPPAWTAAPVIANPTLGPSMWSWHPAVTLDDSDAPIVLQAKSRIEARASDADGDPVQLVAELHDDDGDVTRLVGVPPPPGQPMIVDLPALEMDATYCEMDGDAVDLLAELRPTGGPLTGIPTHRAAGPPWMAHFEWIGLPLPEVEVGTHYQLAWWFRDSYGAESKKSVVADFMRSQ